MEAFMRLTFALAVGIALTVAGASFVLAQPSGPVATACKVDIATLCPNLPHNGSVRACLTEHESKVSASCKHAFGSTGGSWMRSR
jgi:hypothetical protein